MPGLTLPQAASTFTTLVFLAYQVHVFLVCQVHVGGRDSEAVSGRSYSAKQ